MQSCVPFSVMSLLKEIPFLVRATLDKCFSMLVSKIRDLPFLMDEDIKGRIRHERLQKIRHYNRKKKKKHHEQSEEEEEPESKDPSTPPSKPPTVKQKPKLKSPSSMSQEEMVEVQDMIMNHVPKVYIMEDGSNKPEPFKSGMTETGTIAAGTVKARPVSKKSIPSILKRSPVKPRPVKRVTAADVEAMTSSVLKKRAVTKHEPKVIKPKKVKQAKKKVEKQKPNVIGYGRLPTATNISVTQSLSSGLQKPHKKTKAS